MSTAPRTDAIREKINASDDCHAEDIITALAFAETLEQENANLGERLKLWETAFETTNVAQAAAEHVAVLAKRDALMRENQTLRDDLAAARAEADGAKKQLGRARADDAPDTTL